MAFSATVLFAHLLSFGLWLRRLWLFFYGTLLIHFSTYLNMFAFLSNLVFPLFLFIYHLRFKLIVTLWHFTLFTNCTLTIVCDLYVNKNIDMWDLVRFVLVCILLICTFYNFYKYKTKDICPQSSALTCVKSVSVTINLKQR